MTGHDKRSFLSFVMYAKMDSSEVSFGIMNNG